MYRGYLKDLEAYMAELNCATVSGRYYAMDRDNRWDRELAYNAIVHGQDETAGSACLWSYPNDPYDKDAADEFVLLQSLMLKGHQRWKCSYPL